MAYFNPYNDAHAKKCNEKYAELKNLISGKEDNGIIPEWYLAYEQLIMMEREISRQKDEIDKYQKFFYSLQNLLPKQFTVNTPIR